MEVIVTLPESVARSLGETPEDISRRILEHTAIEGYRTGRLSHRQVGEMLGLDYWQTDQFFAEHQVTLNYSVADLEADRMTLDQILKDQ